MSRPGHRSPIASTTVSAKQLARTMDPSARSPLVFCLRMLRAADLHRSLEASPRDSRRRKMHALAQTARVERTRVASARGTKAGGGNGTVPGRKQSGRLGLVLFTRYGTRLHEF